MDNNSVSSALVGYDNLMRQLMVVNSDDEFTTFCLNQEECRIKWLACEQEIEHVRQQIAEAEHQKKKLEAKNHHVHGLLQSEVRKRVLEQKEKKDMEQKLELVRNTLCDEDAISVDTTEKLKLFLQPKNRRSINFQEMETIEEVPSATSSSLNEKSDEELELSGLVRSYRDVQRSSTPFVESRRSQEGARALDGRPPFDGFFAACSSLIRSPQRPSNPSAIFGTRQATEDNHKANEIHPHSYKKHTVLHSANCQPCGLRIRFGRVAFKCVNCGETCHTECEELMSSCTVAIADPEVKKKKTVTFFTSPGNNH